MATRGFENVTQQDINRRLLKQMAKPSKFRNVKVVIDGEKFDSKREAAYYQGLKLREFAGEITEVKRQVRFPLLAPDRNYGHDVMVAEYVADFTYISGNGLNVVDAKGKRTQMYQLKKKWLELQDGVVIEEV